MELKPCPFCGEVPRLEVISAYRNYPDFYEIHHLCRSAVATCYGAFSRKELIELWNRRADDDKV